MAGEAVGNGGRCSSATQDYSVNAKDSGEATVATVKNVSLNFSFYFFLCFLFPSFFLPLFVFSLFDPIFVKLKFKI